MSESVETFVHRGIMCEIHYDAHSFNPYAEFDRVSELLCGLRDYTFGTNYDFSKFKSTRHAARYLTMFEGYALAIPFNFQDYGSGGARIYLEEPNDNSSDYPSIDGFLVLSREAYQREFAGMALHDNGEEFSAEKTIRAEFNELKAWVEGNVFGWIVARGSDDEESCWGYYGDLDYVKSEARDAAEYIAHDRFINEEPPDIAEVMRQQTQSVG